MKKLLSLAAMLCYLLLAVTVHAQKEQMLAQMKNSTPEQRAKMQSDLMKQKLSLDDVKTKAIYDICLKYAQKMEPLKNQERGMKLFRQAKAINDDKEKEFKTVLTPEEYDKYEEAKKEMLEAMKEKRGKG